MEQSPVSPAQVKVQINGNKDHAAAQPPVKTKAQLKAERREKQGNILIRNITFNNSNKSNSVQLLSQNTSIKSYSLQLSEYLIWKLQCKTSFFPSQIWEFVSEWFYSIPITVLASSAYNIELCLERWLRN